MKIKNKIVIPALVISLSGVIFYFIKNLPIKFNQKDVDLKDDFVGNQDEITNEIVMQKLIVLENKCRGCGWCTRIDPAHFEINPQTGKAMVISSTNLDSPSLIQAINNCPDEAISLE